MRALRVILPLLVAAVLSLPFLTGCAKQNEPETPRAARTGNYSTTCNIRYRELKAVATISQETPSSCTVQFSSPPSLTDMAFIFREGSVDLNYKGLSFRFDPESLPGGAIANIAVSAINKAMKDEGLSVVTDSGALEVRGMMESGEFVLHMDGANGNLLKLSVPAEDLEIEFVNFDFLD